MQCVSHKLMAEDNCCKVNKNAARFKDYDKLKKLNITDCIECGSCAYVCPSKRHQVQQIHTAKAIIREKSKK